MGHLWGIDLGGTKIEGVVLESKENISPLCRERIPTEGHLGYDHILARISELINLMSKKVGLKPTRVGFGTPGALEPGKNAMKNCNTTCLNGKPLKDDLERLLSLPVALENDANCFALAEAKLGAAKGSDVVFGVIMGTGVGGGIVLNGKCHEGHQGIAGEWGHNVLEDGGAPCYCGKRGCVESVISGPALESFYERISGTKLSLSEIEAKAINKQDIYAEATIDRLTSFFSKAISVVINILDPNAIVLGGGVSNIKALYAMETLEKLKIHVFNSECKTRIVKNSLGDSAGVFGAALL